MDPAGGCPDKAVALPREKSADPGVDSLPESLPKAGPIFAMNIVGRIDGIAVGPLDDKEEERPIPLPACHSFDLKETFMI